jgi:hypothetical protein
MIILPLSNLLVLFGFDEIPVREPSCGRVILTIYVMISIITAGFGFYSDVEPQYHVGSPHPPSFR